MLNDLLSLCLHTQPLPALTFSRPLTVEVGNQTDPSRLTADRARASQKRDVLSVTSDDTHFYCPMPMVDLGQVDAQCRENRDLLDLETKILFFSAFLFLVPQCFDVRSCKIYQLIFSFGSGQLLASSRLPLIQYP